MDIQCCNSISPDGNFICIPGSATAPKDIMERWMRFQLRTGTTDISYSHDLPCSFDEYFGGRLPEWMDQRFTPSALADATGDRFPLADDTLKKDMKVLQLTAYLSTFLEAMKKLPRDQSCSVSVSEPKSLFRANWVFDPTVVATAGGVVVRSVGGSMKFEQITSELDSSGVHVKVSKPLCEFQELALKKINEQGQRDLVDPSHPACKMREDVIACTLAFVAIKSFGSEQRVPAYVDVPHPVIPLRQEIAKTRMWYNFTDSGGLQAMLESGFPIANGCMEYISVLLSEDQTKTVDYWVTPTAVSDIDLPIGMKLFASADEGVTLHGSIVGGVTVRLAAVMDKLQAVMKSIAVENSDIAKYFSTMGTAISTGAVVCDRIGFSMNKKPLPFVACAVAVATAQSKLKDAVLDTTADTLKKAICDEPGDECSIAIENGVKCIDSVLDFKSVGDMKN